MKKHVWKISLLAILALGLIGILWAHQPGRMTGGGSVFVGDMRVTHGFELYCTVDVDGTTFQPGPNNLEINWNGNRFHLENLEAGLCTAGVDPAPPKAPFYKFDGWGTGKYNGVSGFRIRFTLTDKGEPGVNDTAMFDIWEDANPSNDVLYVPENVLTFGNQQAHFCTGNGNCTP